MPSLAETQRPTSLAEFVGNPKAVAAAGRLMAAGIGGTAIWISGPSGTGKTTLALILAHSIASPMSVETVTGRELTPARIRALADASRYYGMGERCGRAIIVNEAHGLGRAAIETLLDILEDIPAHVVWICTTTRDGQERLFDDQDDAGPLLSRCTPLSLSSQGLSKLFAAKAREVAQARGLDGQPESAYLRLVQECKNNLRAVYARIDAGAMLAP